MNHRFLMVVLCFWSLTAVSAQAQQAAQSARGDSVKPPVMDWWPSSKALKIGLQLQSRLEYSLAPTQPGQNRFRARRSRIEMGGTIKDFGYRLQVDFGNVPAFLDAFLSYGNNRYNVRAGIFKPPISAENLQSSKVIDFIRRSRIVETLANNRDVGVAAVIKPSKSLQLQAGMFNGTRHNLNQNDNNHFYYAGRVQWTNQTAFGLRIQAGVNGGTGIDQDIFIAKRQVPRINGRRLLYGVDLRLTMGPWLLYSEALWGDLEYGPETDDLVRGYFVTGGYRITPNVQVVARLDHQQSRVVDFRFANRFTTGLNTKINKYVRFQLNHEFNPGGGDNGWDSHGFIAQLQLAM